MSKMTEMTARYDFDSKARASLVADLSKVAMNEELSLADLDSQNAQAESELQHCRDAFTFIASQKQAEEISTSQACVPSQVVASVFPRSNKRPFARSPASWDDDSGSDGSPVISHVPVLSRPVRPTLADRHGRVAKTVRFTASGVGDFSSDGGTSMPVSSRVPSLSPSVLSPSLLDPPTHLLPPRGSSPIPITRSRALAPALPVVYGQGAGSRARGPVIDNVVSASASVPARRSGFDGSPDVFSPKPFIRSRPETKGASANFHRPGVIMGGSRVVEDDAQSVLSQSSLFGSKLATVRF